MASSKSETERSFLVAERALELMKAFGSSACPRSYEVWYTYVSGHKPLMNDAIKRLTAERGTLSDNEIDIIYDSHLCTQRHAVEAEKTSAKRHLGNRRSHGDDRLRLGVDGEVWRVPRSPFERSRGTDRPCPRARGHRGLGKRHERGGI